MIKHTIMGKYIAQGRLNIVKREVDVIKSQNPDIDWDSNDLVLTVVPKTESKPEGT